MTSNVPVAPRGVWPWRWFHGISIRALSIGLVILCLLPSLVMAALLAHQLASSKRAILQNNTERISRELAATLDREVAGMKYMLMTIATSQNLHQADLRSVERRLREVAAVRGVHIVLRDPYRQQQLINTAVPPGTPLEPMPSVIPAEQQEILQTFKPTVSNLVYGPVLKQLITIVQIPVLKDDKVVYLLSAILTPQYIRKLFDKVPFGDIDRIVVADGNGRAITRFLEPDKWVGRQLSNELVGNAPGMSGTWDGHNRAGVYVFGAYHRLSEAPWIVGATVPQAVVNEPYRNALIVIFVFGAVLLAVSIYVADRFGSAISLAVRRLANAGVDFDVKANEPAVVTPFSEANAAYKALSRAARDLRHTEEQHRFAADAAGAGAFERNIVTGELHWSARLKEMIGVLPDAKPDEDLFVSLAVPADRALILENRRRYREDPSRPAHYEYEFRLAATDSHPQRWLSAKGRIERNQAGEAIRVYGILLDITERKQMESDREDLRRRLMSVQENERLRLSHELHDETGQILAAALLELKMIESMSTPEAIARINTLQKRLEGMGQSLHRIAWELRPASLGELGLADAVQNYAASWSRQYGIETDVHCEGDLAHLESEVSTAVYRVLQEALTNVAKHAKSATVVSIVLDHADGQLRLTIEDDGQGFESSDHTTGGPSGGIGLAGVRERVALIGGTVEIESSVHAGTGIFARIPVARAA